MIEIDAADVVGIPVKLVGIEYEITPPKAAFAMRIAVQAKLFNDDPAKIMEVMDEWVVKAFGKSNAAKIQKRIDDEKDALDITHVMQLMEKVIESQSETEDPTS